MTPKTTPEPLENLRPSILPFDPADLVAMRVKPAQFARMCGVSKQAVSQWVKEGKITPGPDGLIDPVVASRQVFERTDPGRLRARIFRDAMAPYGDLQRRVRELEAELATWKEVRPLFMHHDEIYERGAELSRALAANLDRLIAGEASGALDEELEMLWMIHFWRMSPEDFEDKPASMPPNSLTQDADGGLDGD